MRLRGYMQILGLLLTMSRAGEAQSVTPLPASPYLAPPGHGAIPDRAAAQAIPSEKRPNPRVRAPLTLSPEQLRVTSVAPMVKATPAGATLPLPKNNHQ